MFYFKKHSGDDSDAIQLQALQEFRRRVADEGLLYWEFDAPEQFSQLVRVHLTRHIQRWSKLHSELRDQTARADLATRFREYLQSVNAKSTELQHITLAFAKNHLKFNTENKQRASQVRSMANQDLTEEFRMRTLIEIADGLARYADATEIFEEKFNSAFSVFIENVLSAAVISIALPNAKTKSLIQVLVELRRKLHPISGTISEYVSQLEKSSHLTGVMATSNQRSISALKKFREHAQFGERLLLESEKLFAARR